MLGNLWGMLTQDINPTHTKVYHKQVNYVFTVSGTAIYWRSTKQTLVTTSSNHAEIIALSEAVREGI